MCLLVSVATTNTITTMVAPVGLLATPTVVDDHDIGARPSETFAETPIRRAVWERRRLHRVGYDWRAGVPAGSSWLTGGFGASVVTG